MKILFIALTNLCDKRCPYCPMAFWRNNPDFPNTLTLESTISAIEKLRPTHAEITGGEPTLVPWLDELCNYLDSQKIVYLVKSNGYKRCKNQVTAWHDDVANQPKNYDKILLIFDPHKTDKYEAKANYCDTNHIPYADIGLDRLQLNRFGTHETFFLRPTGELKECHAGEIIINDVNELRAENVEWKAKCRNCKAVNDFVLFLDIK
jgi:organic radical activating enzyme